MNSLPAITLHKLAGGITVVFVNSSKFKSSRAEIIFDIGKLKLELKEYVALHILEHLILDKNKNYPNAVDLLDEDISSANGILGSESSSVFIEAPKRLFLRNLRILVDLLLNPTITEERIGYEKKVIFEEIEGSLDGLEGYLAELMEGILWENSPYADSYLDQEAVEKVNFEDVVRAHKKILSSLQAVILVGDFDKTEVTELIEQNFNRLIYKPHTKVSKLLISKKLPAISVVPANIKQTMLSMAWAFEKKPFDDTYLALGILEDLTDGNEAYPLFKKVRSEKRLVYQLQSYTFSSSYAASLRLNTQTSSERMKELITSILEEIQKLADGEISDTLVEKLKSKWVSANRSGVEDPEFWTYYLGKSIEAGEDVIYAFKREICKVVGLEPQSVRDAARKLFSKKVAVVAAGFIAPTEAKEISELFKRCLGVDQVFIDDPTQKYIRESTALGKVRNRIDSLIRRK